MLVPNELLQKSTLRGTARLAFRILFRHGWLMLCIVFFILVPLDFLSSGLAVLLTAFIDAIIPATGFLTTIEFYCQCLVTPISSSVVALVVGALIEGDIPTIRNTLNSLTGERLRKLIGTDFLVILIVLSPMLLLTIVLIAGEFFAVSFGPWRIALFVIALSTSVVLMVKSLFALYVAVFEGTYYMPAFYRSMALIRGYGWKLGWLTLVSILLVIVGAVVIALLPELMGAPDSGFDSPAGFTRTIVETAVMDFGSLILSIFFALVYFHRRRDLHDLSFYDIQGNGVIQPASKILEP